VDGYVLDSPDGGVGVVVRVPSPPLEPFVERLGYYAGGVAGGWEPVPPTGADHLLVNLGSGEFWWRAGAGPGAACVRSGVVVVPGSEGRVRVDLGQWRRAVFVSFHPGGACSLLGLPSAAAGEPLLDLEEAWGRGARLLRDRLAEAATAGAALAVMEDALLAHAVRPLRRDPVVAAAVTALDRGLSVAQVAVTLGVSQSTLLRRFTAQVGVPPKRLARIRRLRRLLAAAHGRPGCGWAQAAAECGYFDQAHMIAEFRALAGMTPAQYRPRLTQPYEVGPPRGDGFLQ
jgi:AraC-like DNA-binding protein